MEKIIKTIVIVLLSISTAFFCSMYFITKAEVRVVEAERTGMAISFTTDMAGAMASHMELLDKCVRVNEVE